MPDLQVRCDVPGASGALPIVRLSGPLVHGEHLDKLRDTVRGLIADGRHHIVLDVANVDALDSTGIAALLSIKRAIGGTGRITLLCPTQRLRNALAMIRATVLFEMVDDEAQLPTE